MSRENLAPYLEEYGNLRTQKKEIEDKLKELDGTVRPLLEGLGMIVEGNYTFELKLNKGRKTLDKAAMAADGIDIDKYYKVGAPYTALFVKELG
jgi:hypothetical protein